MSKDNVTDGLQDFISAFGVRADRVARAQATADHALAAERKKPFKRYRRSQKRKTSAAENEPTTNGQAD
jgi:hypothetical protein